jgi:hypothetical protein
MPTPPFLNNVDANGNIIFYIEILNEATNIREWISGDGSLTEGGEWESSLGCYGDWTLIRGPDL